MNLLTRLFSMALSGAYPPPALRVAVLVMLLFVGAAGPAAQAQSAGVFARMGFGARGIALGNALVADASGQASPFYNPALAPLTARQRIDATFGLLTHDRELQHLQFAVPLKPVAGIAAGLIHAGVSDLDGRDASGYHTETYSTDDFAFFFAFGLRLSERTSAGVGIRLYRNDLFPDIDAVNTVGLSAGLAVRLTEQLHLGLAADDLLAQYDWDSTPAFGEDGRSTTDRFPTRLRLGASYRLTEGRGLVAVEYEALFDYGEAVARDVELIGGVPTVVTRTERINVRSGRLRAGAEWWAAEPFAVRAGVDRIGTGTAGEITPTAGFSIRQDLGQLGALIDYAFALEPYALGTMHLLSLRLQL